MRGIKYRKPEEMKDSGVEWIGKVPKEWDIIKGKNLYTSKKIINRGGIKDIISLTLKGVIDRDPDSNDGLQPKDFNSYQEFKKNDLVFKLIDLENINTSRVGIVHKDGLMSPAYIRLIKKPKKTYNKFYYYLYYSFYTKNIYNNIGNSGVRSSMNSSDLLNMGILCLSYFEQQQVANFLDIKTAQFDSIISKKENLIEKLEEAKKSLISEIVTGKVKIVDGQMVKRKPEEMKDSGVEWLGMIPKEWEVKKIKYLTELNNRTLSNNEKRELSINYIDIGSVNNSGEINMVQSLMFEKAPSRARRVIKTNDVIVSTVRTYLKAIAHIGEKYNNHVCSTGFAVFSPKKEIINSKFFYYIISSDKYIDQIVRRSVGVSYPAINASDISELPCINPEVGIQKVIVNFLDSKVEKISRVINKTQTQIQKLKEARQSLISEAVTGKIDLRDWDIIGKEEHNDYQYHPRYIKREVFSNPNKRIFGQ